MLDHHLENIDQNQTTTIFVCLLLIMSIWVSDTLANDVFDQQSTVITAFSGDLVNTSCYGMIEINNTILANIHTEEHGCELHKLDDQGGSSLFADINAGPVDYGYSRDDFGLLPALNGWYYLEANDGVHGNQLWRTDGTIIEPVGSGDEWPEHTRVVSRDILNDRLYLTVEFPDDERYMYSTSGLDMRLEPNLLPDASSQTEIIGTFQDKLLIWGEDEQHGREPWTFDGTDYQLLGDLNVGPDSSLNFNTRYLFFDGFWVFDAVKFDSQGNEIQAFTKTNGLQVVDTNHTGPWDKTEGPFTKTDYFIRTTTAMYLAQNLSFALADPPCHFMTVVRVDDDSSADYPLIEGPRDCEPATAAILNDDALVLVDNVLYKLGETSAGQIDFTIPSDWENSRFTFVGSNPYFNHAYIKERLSGEGSRFWVWNHSEAGLLMAGETPVFSAEHFRHIGNDIYFYGADVLNGYALRKVSDSVVKPVPRLAAVTGSWYDPATSGQGFVLHPVNDDQTVFSFFGFEDDGTPLWLTGVNEGSLETAYSTEFTMYINSGGDFGSFTPDQITEEEWGTMRITFDTCSKATAELDGLSGQQALDLVRLTRLERLECDRKPPPSPGTSGITGSWYDPATSGQGLVLHSMNDEQMAVSFYGYKNNSERLWLIGAYTGQVEFGQSLVMDMAFATGGSFGGFSPEEITETEWGTLTINFNDCRNATATLDGIDGQQTMSMLKLAGLQGSELECQ